MDKTTVFNWEAGTAGPNLRALPGVIHFLGYAPTEIGSTLGECLRAARRRLGLSLADLAGRLGVDPSTILNWETGRYRPIRRHRDQVAAFIEQAAPAKASASPLRVPEPSRGEDGGNGADTASD